MKPISAKSALALSDLAIATSKPHFAEPLHVGRPNVGSEEALLARIRGILDRRWFTNNGPLVLEFEEHCARLLDVRHCVATCNATIALEIAIRALAFAGEVIVPSFTFIATAHALQWQGITPVFCDIGRDSHNLDPEQVERLITPRTSGILGVHVWGKGCDHEQLSAIAARHRLKLLFDASHAFGCTHQGRPIGSFGECEVFSFHATKFFNTFEGGAIVTNNDALAGKLRLMRNFGFAGVDDVRSLGTNGKMSEVSAAMGLTGLESLPSFIDANRRNYQLYQQQLAGLQGVRLFEYDERERHNFQYIVLEIDASTARLTRDHLIRLLEAENVLARRYFYPGCHRMEPYRSLFPQAGSLLARTEALAERVLVLPTGSAVSAADVAGICQILHTALQFPGECRRLLDG